MYVIEFLFIEDYVENEGKINYMNVNKTHVSKNQKENLNLKISVFSQSS